MGLKYKCKWCGTGTSDSRGICFNCREKYTILKGSGLFGGKAKKKQYKTTWERTDAYPYDMGSGTKSLIDFVNKSGTIHYGRVVARELMK